MKRAVFLLIAALTLCSCGDVTRPQIDAAITYCEPNGGLRSMNRYEFYCGNGLKGTVKD